MRFIFLLLLPQVSFCANYLIFATLISRSIKNTFIPVAEELAARGNNVTLVTPFRFSKPKPGIKEIVLDGAREIIEIMTDSFRPGKKPRKLYELDSISNFKEATLLTCQYIFENEDMKAIISGEEKYDLAIVNFLFEDCPLGIVYKLGIPFVYVSSFGYPIESSHNLRVPSCMSYCPLFVGTGYSDRMSFTERLSNTWNTLLLMFMQEYYISSPVTSFLRERFDKDIPHAKDIEKNVSLVIVNDHFSFNYPRPLMPHIIEAAGMHLRPPEPLPKEIAEWISGSGEDGFIYMSFGTIVPSHKLPENYRKIILTTFSKLKQRVLWKLNEPFEDLPANVMASSWLPQQDILGDRRCRLFISHGGLLSIQEATYHMVPVLGLPVSTDGPFNLKKVEATGTGILLNWEDVTEETFYASIIKLITNASFKENAIKRREITQDLQSSPLETAVFWIEYVLRHNGAEHLKSGAMYLSDYEYYQLDVWGILIAVVLFGLWCIWKFCRMLFKILFKKKRKPHKKKE